MAKVSALVKSTLKSTASINQAGRTLRTSFEAKGIRVLGSGMYGAAIEDNGEVFKVFGSEERGYGAFIRFMKGKSSCLLPRVKVVGKIGSYTCAHIERLYPLSEMGASAAYDLADWVAYVAHTHRYKKYGLGYQQSRVKFPVGAEKYVNKANMVGLIKKMVDWMLENQQDGRYGLDLHTGNFMLRRNADGTKQVVITDPFCNA